MNTFGISVNQASTDLNRYLDMAPGNMAYDKSARTYIRSQQFEPLFLKPDPHQYLSQLRSVADGLLEPDAAWVAHFPPYDATPAPARGINAATLRAIIAAIRHADAVEVKYQSMSAPEPRWRWIAPHAIAFDGFRWHTRARCLSEHSFKDFLLSRILETRDTRPGEPGPDADADWHEHVTLEIGPHPELSDAQRKVIELDYGMDNGKVSIPVRKALLYYALRRLGLDTAPTARQPMEQQIVLLNREAVLGSKR